MRHPGHLLNYENAPTANIDDILQPACRAIRRRKRTERIRAGSSGMVKSFNKAYEW